MGLKTNFMNVLIGGGNQVIDTMNIEAQREYEQTRAHIAEANSQWTKTLAGNKQANENYQSFLKYIKSRPDEFSGNWDRRLAGLYQDNPGLFKGKSFDDIKDGVAKELVSYKLDTDRLEEGSEDPYIPQADYFKLNQDKIRKQIGNVSGMNNVVDLMTSESKFRDSKTNIPEDVKRFSANMATATMTAYGYGILRQQPTSPYNQKLLEMEKLRIIAANAKRYTSQESKSKFLTDALTANSIDLSEIFYFNKPIKATNLLKLLDTNLSADTLRVENALSNFTRLELGLSKKDEGVTKEMVDQARVRYENLRDGMAVKVNKYINTNMGATIPFDVGQIKEAPAPEVVPLDTTPKVPEGYKPQINFNGEINLIDGTKVSIEDILDNKEQYIKSQPPEVMAYIDQFAPLFDADGDMIKPTREMFTAGKSGDKLFKKFTRIYMGLNITEFIPVGPYKSQDVDQESILDKIKKLLPQDISEEDLKKIKPKKKVK
jgi:hypothetical protein